MIEKKLISRSGRSARRVAVGSFLMVAGFFTGSVSASTIPDHILIEKMHHCMPTRDMGPSYVIYDQTTNVLSGWSHIYEDPDSFPGLTFDPEQYRVDSTNVSNDNQCWNLNVYNAILVKKYADWDRQHATGLVSDFSDEGVKFGDIKDVVLEIKLNSEKISIPDKMSYLSAYGSYTDIDNLLEMDHGKVNLGITVYGEDDPDQSIETFQGMINLELDQREFSDRWLRIVIPVESFWYFVQKNYANTEKDLKDYLGSHVVGLRINPETHNTKVLRNYISDTFSESIPESYKEEGVSIRKLSVRLKGEDGYWWGNNPNYSGFGHGHGHGFSFGSQADE